MYKNPISQEIGNLLSQAIDLEKKMSIGDYHQKNEYVRKIKEKFEQLIKSDVSDLNHKKTTNIYKEDS